MKQFFLVPAILLVGCVHAPAANLDALKAASEGANYNDPAAGFTYAYALDEVGKTSEAYYQYIMSEYAARADAMICQNKRAWIGAVESIKNPQKSCLLATKVTKLSQVEREALYQNISSGLTGLLQRKPNLWICEKSAIYYNELNASLGQIKTTKAVDEQIPVINKDKVGLKLVSSSEYKKALEGSRESAMKMVKVHLKLK